MFDNMTVTRKEKITKKDFVNSLYANDVVRLSRGHTRYVQYWNFMDKVQSGTIKCPQVLKQMTNLCLLFGLQQLYNDCVSCFECGYFSKKTYSDFI